jgi:uncharacterized protein (DUF1330 family)
MAVYLISDVIVRDKEAVEKYRQLAAASIEKWGGRYLVRGGAIYVLEGDQHPSTIIVVEFPSRKIANEWYRSSDYAKALEFRDDALSRSLILVEGLG